MKKVVMLTDPDCIQCAILFKVMEEYCKNNLIEFKYIEDKDIPSVLRPKAYPTFKIQYFDAGAELWVDSADFDYLKTLSDDFKEIYLKKHW